jgi:hypothetical protein
MLALRQGTEKYIEPETPSAAIRSRRESSGLKLARYRSWELVSCWSRSEMPCWDSNLRPGRSKHTKRTSMKKSSLFARTPTDRRLTAPLAGSGRFWCGAQRVPEGSLGLGLRRPSWPETRQQPAQHAGSGVPSGSLEACLVRAKTPAQPSVHAGAQKAISYQYQRKLSH